MASKGTDWESVWSKGMLPWSKSLEKGTKFDVGGPSQLLVEALKRIPKPEAGATALVPGCGRAYDAIALAQHGFEKVVAVDISKTACQAAEEEMRSASEVDSERVEITCADFFKFDHEPFDLVWDCTFFCALDPSMRADWAKKTMDLVKSGGALVTCIFPIFRSPRKGGPPFAMTVDLMRETLLPIGFKEEFVDDELPDAAQHKPGGFTGVIGFIVRTFIMPPADSALGIWRKES